jgi:septal ring factor EnvC (AmiA/AmiB activator)
MSLEDTIFRFFILMELGLRRERVQGKINRYLATVGDYDDERLDLQLQIACLERDIIDIKIALINTTNDDERRRKEQQIETKEQQIETKEQLILTQQMQVVQLQQPQAQPGNYIFLCFLTFPPFKLFFM